MNQRVVSLIILVLSLILLGIFGVYFLISRQIVSAPAPVVDETVDELPPPTVFPPSEVKPNVPTTVATSSAATSSPTQDTTASEPDPKPLEIGLSLVPVAEEPVVSVFRLGTGTSSAMAYIKRADGHLFTVNSNNEISRLSNTTVPKTVAGRGGRSASSTNLAFQTLDNRSSRWFITNTASSSLDSLALLPLSSAVRDLLVAPDQKSLMLVENSGDGTTLRPSDWQGRVGAVLLSLPLKELAVAWPHPELITLQTKPSAEAPGSLYLFNLRTKRLELVINEVIGLSSLMSPDGRYLAYSGLSAKTLFTALYDRETKAVTRLPFATLIEKCRWGNTAAVLFCAVPTNLPPATYPDDWYQGTVATADSLWRLEAASKQVKRFYDPASDNLGQTIDATSLTTDSADQQLFLINKTDLRLWLLPLNLGF